MAKRSLQDLVRQTEELHLSALQSFRGGCWLDNERHLAVLNRLVAAAYECGQFDGISGTRPLPKRGRGNFDSQAQKAKLMEVVQKSRVLRDHLRLLTGSPGAAGSGDSLVWALARVRRLCDRFHCIAAHVKCGYRGRKVCRVSDEYDVQWLCKALLLLDFEDVRPEEWTPSYAGGASRIDFLIAPQGVLLETKMTRDGLGDKKVGEELIIDATRYRKHPDCRALFCFVYDPGKHISNARGLERDLTGMSKRNYVVEVVVRP